MTQKIDANGLRAVIDNYVNAMNRGDIDRLRTLFAEDCEIQGVTGKGAFDFASRIWQKLHDSLNMHLEVEDCVVQGNRAAVRFRETGRWTAPFLDFSHPTGNSYELLAMEWFEITDGKISRRWGVRDAAAQARQLAFPVAAGPKPSEEEAA
ncbi:ester cyclase [Nitratireductor sp. CH_MIT9313-5]|uniref:ester cyclase n=1 Tax=Nitratireductor sp. CH_MIT9313-5 TaxID=3107764 RepID=UPI00300B681A